MGQLTIEGALKDIELMEKARHIAASSLDPSTQTGCVLATANGRLLSTGHNKFPRGVWRTEERDEDRPTRLAMTVHAEVMALLNIEHERYMPHTAYLHPWPPCADCAGILIEAGIERVVAPAPTPEQERRWGDSFAIMKTMFNEAGVTLDLTT